ncbi:MAG: hypothetical protein IKG93_09130 [Clostridiales bacterium]|nr:hypothetical protein [Clostridiales bacterium]
MISAKPTGSIGTTNNLKVTATTTNSISLSWSKVSTHLDSRRTYYYRVRAYYYYYDGNWKVHRVYGAYSTIVAGRTK